MSDYELLYFIYQHDDEALEMLLEKYHMRVYYIVKAVFTRNGYHPTFNDELDEFIHLGNTEVQEAIYRYRDDGKCSFQSFVYACLTLRIKKEVRQKRSHTNQMMDQAFRLDECVKEKENLYFVDLVENHYREFEGDKILDPFNLIDILEYLKKELKPDEYQIAEFMFKGYRQAETSIILKITNKRVSYVCKKIRKLIRKQLSKENL
ncbi:MAG: sigma-70 family RNA polymerase sigma factor [Traorella sp.]